MAKCSVRLVNVGRLVRTSNCGCDCLVLRSKPETKTGKFGGRFVSLCLASNSRPDITDPSRHSCQRCSAHDTLQDFPLGRDQVPVVVCQCRPATSRDETLPCKQQFPVQAKVLNDTVSTIIPPNFTPPLIPALHSRYS